MWSNQEQGNDSKIMGDKLHWSQGRKCWKMQEGFFFFFLDVEYWGGVKPDTITLYNWNKDAHLHTWFHSYTKQKHQNPDEDCTRSTSSAQHVPLPLLVRNAKHRLDTVKSQKRTELEWQSWSHHFQVDLSEWCWTADVESCKDLRPVSCEHGPKSVTHLRTLRAIGGMQDSKCSVITCSKCQNKPSACYCCHCVMILSMQGVKLRQREVSLVLKVLASWSFPWWWW